MLIVDLIAGALIAGMVVWGVKVGVAATLALAGFAAGAVLGAELAPLALSKGQEDGFALVLALPAALLVGALLAAGIERRSFRLRRPLDRLERLGPVSAIGGAVLAGWIGVVAVWLAGTVVAQVGSLRDAVDGSAIVSRLDAVLAPPGSSPTQGDRPLDPFPVFAGPGPPIRPVDPGVVSDPQVRMADRSVVKIGALTCGHGVQGSGWVGADGVVVTNAHIAAAADVMTVKVGGTGPSLPATVIWFDPVNDVALLRVTELHGVSALSLVRRPRRGTSGALLGFPGGLHATRPARLGPTTTTLRGRMGGIPLGREFPRELAGRPVTEFRGLSEPGSSGGPLVDARGRVLTTDFGGRGTQISGLGVPNRFVRAALRRAGPPVGTGPCPDSRANPGER